MAQHITKNVNGDVKILSEAEYQRQGEGELQLSSALVTSAITTFLTYHFLGVAGPAEKITLIIVCIVSAVIGWKSWIWFVLCLSIVIASPVA